VIETAIFTGGKKYKVVLVDTIPDADVYVNTVLLERNLALPDNTEQFLENMDVVCSEGADSSEESDIETLITDLPEISTPQLHDTNAAIPLAEESLSCKSDDEYDIVVDDFQKFVMNVMGVSTWFTSMTCSEITGNYCIPPSVEV
jgi:hypothetical protein